MHYKQLCAQPLPFAWHSPHLLLRAVLRRVCCVQQSIDISYIAAGLTAANPLQRRAAAGWDRQTNGRTPGSCIDPAPRVAMQAMPINRRSDGHNTD